MRRDSQRPVVAPLRRVEGDIGQPFEMQAEKAQFQRLLDQQHRLLGELPLVAHEGEDHANRQLIGEREPGGEIDGNDAFDAEDRVIRRLEGDPGPADADIGVDYRRSG